MTLLSKALVQVILISILLECIFFTNLFLSHASIDRYTICLGFLPIEAVATSHSRAYRALANKPNITHRELMTLQTSAFLLSLLTFIIAYKIYFLYFAR